jgi:hypothetical protein
VLAPIPTGPDANIGSSALAIMSIENQWSSSVNVDTPLSSAMRAVVASVWAKEPGAPAA